MALKQYSRAYWFPNGALAVGVPARIFPENSNALAPIFTDGTGATPLPNPVNTDAFGVLTFWAETGFYWVYIDAEAFLVSVGMTQEDADLSTGIASGGDVTVNGVNPQAIDIQPFDGWISNFSADDETAPTPTRIKRSTVTTVALDAAGLLRPVTWWLVDSTNTIIQQGTRPTNAQRRTHIVLGVTGFAAGVIVVAQSLPDLLNHPVGQFGDLADSLGGFNALQSGNEISANGVNLQFNQAAGDVFSRAFNHYFAGSVTNNPHVSTTIAQTPVQFRHVTRTTTVFGATGTALDVGNYDVGGVVTPVPGGANTATNFRVWLSPTATAAEQVIVQYGQNTFASLATAVAGIGSGAFVPNVVMTEVRAILIGYITVIKSATNLSDPAQAVFTKASKFPPP